ncbi:hypothetical protein B0T22DRAFT_514486 [Podospora appendiculata]|uniref:Uncharacterized protein n=1 Tax=Podospora appendiculata TaxID=314037 RepID=A0AAE1CDQ6_9PEZI|nr:hypothetical protein B0T22DRAFT_514486 [Podospora appendiculata]
MSSYGSSASYASSASYGSDCYESDRYDSDHGGSDHRGDNDSDSYTSSSSDGGSDRSDGLTAGGRSIDRPGSDSDDDGHYPDHLHTHHEMTGSSIASQASRDPTNGYYDRQARVNDEVHSTGSSGSYLDSYSQRHASGSQLGRYDYQRQNDSYQASSSSNARGYDTFTNRYDGEFFEPWGGIHGFMHSYGYKTYDIEGYEDAKSQMAKMRELHGYYTRPVDASLAPAAPSYQMQSFQNSSATPSFSYAQGSRYSSESTASTPLHSSGYVTAAQTSFGGQSSP